MDDISFMIDIKLEFLSKWERKLIWVSWLIVKGSCVLII